MLEHSLLTTFAPRTCGSLAQIGVQRSYRRRAGAKLSVEHSQSRHAGHKSRACAFTIGCSGPRDPRCDLGWPSSTQQANTTKKER